MIDTPPVTAGFTSTSAGGSERRIPTRNPQAHSVFLRERLAQAWNKAENAQAVAHADRHGAYLEFKSDPDADLVSKSLEDMVSKRIRLLNVRTVKELVSNDKTGDMEEKTLTYATVFVAHEKKSHFLRKIQAYAEKETRSGRPKNADLVNSIADIRAALLVESFWVGEKNLIPGETPKWCEVWLRSDADDTHDITQKFETLLEHEQIESMEGDIRFPERTVKAILASRAQLERLMTLSDDIAEYRPAKETPAFWIGMDNEEQAEWVDDLLGRLEADDAMHVAVCIMDTGVNNGHALIAPVLEDDDCHTVIPDWGTHDHDHHGTLMAGIVTYGDLRECLASDDPIALQHCLESSKILPPSGETPPKLWGYVTAQGVSRPEIQSPDRKRIFCLAVTASDTRDRGRPSSWSGELDQLAAGARDTIKRLFIVSAGNANDAGLEENYPAAQVTDSIHDPAQAWNALTVGAYTVLDEITHPSLAGYTPVARRGGLSPFSTTSSTWESRWPVKPEIVMEGGNVADDGAGFATDCGDLSLLSTFWKPTEKHFHPLFATSAAAAQASWFAAQIQVRYPELWPETVRALMVHSAVWTDELRRQFLTGESKTAYARLLRICGYGVPNLERALYSATNSLTLIAQAELQPYDKRESGGFKTKDMHLHALPWPKGALELLPPDTEVHMRVTLSYFVEPGPGEIGWKDRYRYASHGLRFDVNSPGESRDDFLRRINAAARDDEGKHPGTGSSSPYWMIGQARDKGSIHSDIWHGSAQDLASCNHIGIYPTIGWWRERSHLGKWDSRTRYALVVSIVTPEEDVDLYTPVATEVGIAVPIQIQM